MLFLSFSHNLEKTESAHASKRAYSPKSTMSADLTPIALKGVFFVSLNSQNQTGLECSPYGRTTR